MRDVAERHDETHRVRHEHHQQDATRCAREVRTRASGRVLLVALLSMLVVFVTPISAMADTINAEVISGPSQVPILDMYGASIAAPDRFTAAALLMGYGPDAISAWSDDVKAKLSNEGTGGNFYTFASNSVQNYFDVTEHTGIFQDFLNFVGGTFWNAAQALYGNNLWAALYTPEELAAAKSDLERVLSGENIGGGGSSGGEPGTVIPFKPLIADWFTGSYFMKLNGIEYYLAFADQPTATKQLAPNPLTVTLPADIYSNVPEGDYVYAYEFRPRSNGNNVVGPIDIYVIPADKVVMKQNRWFTDVQAVGVSTDTSVIHIYNTYVSYTPTGNTVDLSSVRFTTSTETLSASSNGVGGVSYAMYYYDTTSGGGGGGGDPVVPPTNWPEPEAPEPPELPEPGDPVVEPPEPYEPTTGPTFIWNITNTSEPTDTSDLLEWIKKIFYELKAIHSDLKTWFENLGNAISDGFEAMDNACGQIYDAITENTDELKNQFQSLKIYLRQLFNWLGEKMNFQASGYDDTSVIYWLKRIWSKLGNGDINVRPTDPTTDPTGVWEWLLKLIQNFLIGLASTTNDLISEFADLISQVMHQFPFSIPWDIAAFLAAFSAAPLTPEFDVNIPAIQGWWPELNFHIDLSPYDTAAATIRAIEKILFAAYLVWRSKDLLDFMDVSKWFNG